MLKSHSRLKSVLKEVTPQDPSPGNWAPQAAPRPIIVPQSAVDALKAAEAVGLLLCKLTTPAKTNRITIRSVGKDAKGIMGP
ncbi:hypothetical protein [Aliiroseovarius subalbicans]|uniref:hypothetical protein n=1 Tax=Aliiroseovarius subalbicans TaxID=2925840 RepID=UPI001F58C84E|nr:hypothetical protein [Aliiroseovarius subalbicans]MCI2398569.1 hypothetical protein [Aliiroseovarius subalbicans]